MIDYIIIAAPYLDVKPLYLNLTLTQTLLLSILFNYFAILGVSTQSAPCPADTITRLDKESGKRTCVKCSLLSCPLGEGLSVKCGDVITPQTSISCKPCVLSETYSDVNGPGACKDCTPCGKYRKTKKACTLTSRAECGNCKTGAYEDNLLGICVPCSPCCQSKDDIIIPACQVPGVSSGMRCSFARSEKCSRNIAGIVLPSSIHSTISTDDPKPSPASKMAPHLDPSSNETEQQTQLDAEDEKREGRKDQEIVLIPVSGVAGFLVVVAAIYFVVRRVRQTNVELMESVLSEDRQPLGDGPLKYSVEESKAGNFDSEKGI